MFEFIRSHNRLFLGILVLLIFPSFVFFGVQGYSSFTDSSNAKVAEVDGRGITQMEWDAAHQRNIERFRQQMPTIDMKLLDSPAVRGETLDSLVRERVLLAAAEHMHMGVSDERLQRVFATDPQFAPLRNPDGSVNRDLLMAQGMSSEMFAQSLRQDLAMRQVMQGIGSTVVAPKVVVDTSLDALLQRRQVQFQRFDATGLRSKVNPSDAEIEAFYKGNEALFRAPEQARIDYVVLDLTGFTADHGGTAFEVRSAFDLVDVARLKLTASHSSDTRFLNAQLQHAWSQLAADSPNAGTGVREVTVHVG